MTTPITMPQDYQCAPDLLAGRVIAVTGANDDLGRAAVRAFSQHGATVVLLGGKARHLEKVYDELVALGAPRPAAVPMDLSDTTTAQCDELGEVLDKEFGRLDGLLHAAFEPGLLAPIELYDPATWARVMQVNLSARFLLTRALLPLLKRSTDASVIFTSADVGRQARAYWGAFAAAAFGNEALMQTLAAELTQNTKVRVNSIDPGPTRGFLRSRFYPGEDPTRLPAPEEIIPIFLYLIGPDSRGVSGQSLSAQK